MSIRILIVINILLFLIPGNLAGVLGAHYFKADTFRSYQIISYMFVHGTFIHLFFNMLALFIFGNMLEKMWGASRLMIYYFTCGIGAVLFYYLIFFGRTDSVPVMIGASGAIFGILVAFAMMFPNKAINIYFLFPIKAKYFVLIYAAVELVMGFANITGDVSAHYTHLGGMMTGLIFLKVMQLLQE